MRSFVNSIIQKCIDGYQRIFSYRSSPCRFDPSCSTYAKEAFERYGFFYGLYLTTRRILRCHPWGGHGWDPVPDRKGV